MTHDNLEERDVPDAFLCSLESENILVIGCGQKVALFSIEAPGKEISGKMIP